MQEQSSGSTVEGDVKLVMGHVFEEHSWRNAKGYCEKCNGVIIAIVQTWRKCSGMLSLLSHLVFFGDNLSFLKNN